MRLKLLITFLILTFMLLAISSAHAVELLIKNDLNVLEDGTEILIEDAVSIEAPRNKVSFGVKPGEKKSITGGNVRSFVLVRKFERHRLKYDIFCPKETTTKGLVTVDKAHQNELPGDCKLVRIGHWSKRSGMNWEIIDRESWQKLSDERRGNNKLRR